MALLLYTPDHQERVDQIIIGDIAPEAAPQFVEYWSNRPETPLKFANMDDAIKWGRGANPWATDKRIHKNELDKVYLRTDGVWAHKADPAIPDDPLVDPDRPGHHQAVLGRDGSDYVPHLSRPWRFQRSCMGRG